ncbi:MAG: small multi-drug export protein [Clostridia bacterium]|nr:small multi-drug export protein [Clostridia bacterium]
MSEIIIDFFASLPEELYVLVVSLFPIVELRGSIPLGAGLGMPFYTNYICSVIGNLIPIPFILLFISKFLDFLSRFKRTKPLVDWLRRKADKHSSRVLVEGTESESAELGATDSAEAAATDSVELTATEVAEATVADSAELSANKSEKALTAEGAKPTTIKSKDAVAAEGAELAAADSARAEKQFKSSHRAMSTAVFWALTLFVAIPLPGTGAWTGSLVAALFGLPKRKSFLAVTLGVLISGVIMCLASYGVVGFLQIFA